MFRPTTATSRPSRFTKSSGFARRCCISTSGLKQYLATRSGNPFLESGLTLRPRSGEAVFGPANLVGFGAAGEILKEVQAFETDALATRAATLVQPKARRAGHDRNGL